MSLHGTFIGCGGVLKVSMPTLLEELFGISQNEARRHLRRGEVTIDGEPTEAIDIPVAEVERRRIAIGRNAVEVPSA